MWIMLLLLMATAVAQSHYADLELSVDATGSTEVRGSSDYFRIISSEEYTSKSGGSWVFSLNTNESFSAYVIKLRLPDGSEIDSIKIVGRYRILDDMTIIASGEDMPISIKVAYHLSSEKKDYSIIILAIVSVAAAAGIAFISRRLKEDPLKAVRYTLTENQKRIIDTLIEAKEPITQKQIQHRTKLPKATLSRNIEHLAQKNIIRKQSRGMMNVISLNRLN